MLMHTYTVQCDAGDRLPMKFKMDVKNVKDPLRDFMWDDERLGDLARHLEEKGSGICRKVIKEIGPHISGCQCQLVNKLAVYLEKRDVLNEEDYRQLKREDATGNKLNDVLFTASIEKRGRGRHLIKNLYLSLLDAFLDRGDQWFHYTALYIVRETALKELGLSSGFSIREKIDLKRVIARVPHMSLKTSTALELRSNLKQQSHTEENADLHSILADYCDNTDSKYPLFDLVSAMMLTEGIGRYVSRLVPFHKSYPIEVLRYLKKLTIDKSLRKFATFIGFNEEELDEIESHLPDIQEQIKIFSKVWRMPDLTEQKNEEMLCMVMHKAGINIEALNRQDMPQPGGSSPIVHLHLHQTIRMDSTGSDVSVTEDKNKIFQRNSLKARNKSSGSHPPLGQLRNKQGSSSDQSVDSIPSLTHQQSHISAMSGDTDVSFSSPQLYLRPHSSQSDVYHLDSNVSGQASTSFPSSVLSLQDTLDRNRHIFRPDDEVSPNAQLGIGLYGEVHALEYEGKVYAAKEYRSGLADLEKLKITFGKELIDLDHPNVVPYFGICHCTNGGLPVYIVIMEKLETNLANFILKESKNLTPQGKLSIVRDIADGLAYLHSRSIIHCDLTARNVLLTAQQRCKIADCGNSRVADITSGDGLDKLNINTEVQDYLPPEAMEGDKYDDKFDVFSFGHLLIYIIIMRQPHPLAPPTYREKGKHKARTEVERRQEYIDEMSQKTTVARWLLPITKECLSDYNLERPSMKDVVSKLSRNWLD